MTTNINPARQAPKTSELIDKIGGTDSLKAANRANVAANTEWGLYHTTTMRFAYPLIISGEADMAIDEVLNDNAAKGYVLDRIICNENSPEGHNYVWFMIICRRVKQAQSA